LLDTRVFPFLENFHPRLGARIYLPHSNLLAAELDKGMLNLPGSVGATHIDQSSLVRN